MVARHIGTIVPPASTRQPLPKARAVIQFAVCYLKFEQIVVMSHSHGEPFDR